MWGWRIWDWLDHLSEKIIENWCHWWISYWTCLKVFHSIFFGKSSCISFGDSAFSGWVKIDFISNKKFQGRICLFIDLNPFFYILERLSFCDYEIKNLDTIKHVNSSSTAKRISESILGISDSTGDLPVVDSIHCFFFCESYRFDSHLLWMFWVLNFTKCLTDSFY